MNIFRKILHYQDDTSDKVYVIDVNRINSIYVVTATWGKRTATRLSSQIRGEYSSEYGALREAQKLVIDKMRGKSAYKDATSTLQITGLAPLKTANLAQVYHSNQKEIPRTTVEVNFLPQEQGRKIKL